MIKIITGFDGACPHTDAGVKRLRGGQWVFYPGTRREPGLGEEIPGKGSRFSTRLLNTGKTPEAVTLIVDWDTPDRTEHHDLGFIRHEADQEWTMIPGRREGVRVEYDLLLAPGLTHLGLFPEYNVEQLAGFVRELRAQGVTVEIAGRSRERRPIWMISFKSPNPKAMPFSSRRVIMPMKRPDRIPPKAWRDSLPQTIPWPVICGKNLVSISCR